MNEKPVLILEYVKQIKLVIKRENKIPKISPQKAKKQVSTYISTNFRHIEIFFHQYALLFPQVLLSCLIDEVEQQIKEINSGNLNNDSIILLLIFISLITKSLTDVQSKEIIDGYLRNRLISVSNQIYSSNLEDYTNTILLSYSKMITTISMLSESIFDGFSNTFRTYITSKMNAKKLQPLLQLWVYLSSDLKKAEHLINAICVNIHNINANYQLCICDLILNSIINAITNRPNEYLIFFENNRNIPNSQHLMNQISTWFPKSNYITWPAQMALIFLQGNTFEHHQEFVSKLHKFADARAPTLQSSLRAICIGFQVISHVGKNPNLINIMKPFFEPVYVYCKKNFEKLWVLPQPLPSLITVEFLISTLIISPKLFTDVLAPLYIQSTNTYAAVSLSEFIYRIAIESINCFDNYIIEINEILSPIMHLLSIKLDPSTKRLVYMNIITGFKQNKKLYRHFIAKHPAAIKTFYKIISKRAIDDPVLPIRVLYDLDVTDEPFHNTYWELTAVLLDIFYRKTLPTKFFNVNSHYANDVPEIAQYISQQVYRVVEHGHVIPKRELQIIVKNLEEIGFCTLVFSIEKQLNYVREIFSNLSKIYKKVEISFNEAVNYKSIDKFLALLGNKDNFVSPFTTVLAISNGMEDAFHLIFTYFKMLTKIVLNPVQNQPIAPDIFSQAELIDRWQCTFMISLALMRINEKEMFDIITTIISKQTETTKSATSIIYNSLPPNYYAIFAMVLLSYIEKTCIFEKGTYINIEQITSFQENCIIVLNGIFNKTKFPVASFDPQTFSKLLVHLISISTINEKQLVRQSCCNLVLSIIKVSHIVNIPLNQDDRKTIGKFLNKWLPPPETGMNSYIRVLYAAIEKSLEDIPFDEADIVEYVDIIKSRLIKSESTSELELILIAILKNNFTFGIEQCIKNVFNPNQKIRATFLGALSTVLNKETYKSYLTPTSESLTDILFNSSIDLFKIISSIIPYYQAERVGMLLTQLAASSSNEFELIKILVEHEIQENRQQTQIRKNSLASCAVQYYSRLVASEWLRDLVESILEIINENQNYNLDSDKGQTNFHVIFQRVLDIIEEKAKYVPAGLVKAQILLSCAETSHDKGKNKVLHGFFLNQFLFPVIVDPSSICTVSEINEGSNQCLKYVSELLLIAAKEAALTDDQQIYSFLLKDLAKYHEQINRIMDDVLLIPINEVPKVENIDIDQVEKDLIDEFCLNFDSFEFAYRYMDQSKSYHKSLGSLVSLMKENTNVKENSRNEEEMRNWFFKSPFRSPKNQMIFFLFMHQIKKPIPSEILINHIIKTLETAYNNQFIIIADFGDFEPSLFQFDFIMNPTQHEQLQKSLTNLVSLYIISLQADFLPYLNKFSCIFKPGTTKTINDINNLSFEIGKSIFYLPQSALEFLSPPESSYQIQYDGKDSTIHIYPESIQIIGSVQQVINIDIITTEVIKLDLISTVEPASYESGVAKTKIRVANGKTYKIVYPSTIDLTEIIIEQVKKQKKKSSAQKTIEIKKTSITSLLLNICLSNMVSNSNSKSVKYAAYNLLISTILSSSINHTMEIPQLPKEFLPLAFLPLAMQISDDIAYNNPDLVHSFVCQFHNIKKMISTEEFTISIFYLSPWTKNCSDLILKNHMTLDFLSTITTEAPNEYFSTFIGELWKSFNKVEYYQILLEQICTYRDMKLGSIFIYLGFNHTLNVSQFLTSKLLIYSSNHYQKFFNQCSKIIVSLIFSQAFDFKSCFAQLFHDLTIIRLKGINSLAKSCFDIFYNTFNLVGDTDEKISIDLFITKLDIINFNSDIIDNRDFMVKTQAIVRMLKKMSTHFDSIEEISELFHNDLQSDDELIRLNGLLYLSGLKEDISEKLFGRISDFLSNPSEHVIAAICASLSLIKLDATKKSKVFYIGITSLIFCKQTIAFDLILNLLNSIKTIDELNFDDIPKNVISYLENLSNLPLTQRPVFSLLLIAFYFSNKKFYSPENIYKRLLELGSTEPLLYVLQLQYSSEQQLIDKCKSYVNDKDISNFASILTQLFIRNPDNLQIQSVLTEYMNQNPKCFNSFDFISTIIYSEKIKYLKDCKIIIKFVETAAGETSQNEIIPLLASLYNGKEPHLLLKDQVKIILSGLI